MRNIAGVERAHLCALQSEQRYCSPVVAHKFHLERCAIAMDKHRSANIAALKSSLPADRT
jgi:hypothetical protein